VSGGPARAALFPLHAAVVLFGFAGLFGKWLALPATTLVFGRTAFAALALGALFLAVRGRPRFGWRLVVNGLVLAAHWVSFFEAIRVSTVAIGLLGFASFPLFVLLLETLRGEAPLTAARAGVGALVTAGLLLLVPEFSFAAAEVRGLFWGLLSGATFALLAIWNRVSARERPAREVAFWQNVVAALCLLPWVLVEPAGISARDLALLGVLGVVCTALAHTLFIAALARVSAHTASVVAALEPVYGIALAFALLGEVPGPRTLLGGALIVGAAWLASAQAVRPP
jgi:drug/metabolite transporter (DMT)-like permease